MTRALDEHPGALEAYAAHVPMRRLGTSEEISAVVAFPASSEVSYVTGASIPVDGGLNQIPHLRSTVSPVRS